MQEWQNLIHILVNRVGRPYNSTTPAWRNKAAIKVRAYRWLERDKATKYGCAQMMQMSRTTVIKWWDAMEWSDERRKGFGDVIVWYNTHWENLDYDLCAEELGLSVEEVLLNVATYKELTPKYVLF